MQCPSCQFENMPGLTACGRCNTRLDLKTAVIDVNPPRASRTAKRVRRVTPTTSVYRARDAARRLGGGAAGSIIEDLEVPPPSIGVLSRLGVPGWAHFHEGMRTRGWMYLGLYLAFLLLGLFCWGDFFGAFFLGLAFSVHASSIVDVLISRTPFQFPRFFLTSALVLIVLGALMYAPAGYVLINLAAPISFMGEVQPFKAGDTILVNRWASPRRGGVVAFQPQAGGARRAQGDFEYRFAYNENLLIDRVIGLPGDRVVWDGPSKRLEVNGSAVTWRPLRFEVLPPKLEFVVPERQYLILPTTSIGAERSGQSPNYWQAVSLFGPEQIVGGAYLRVYPSSRFWFIR